MWLVVYYLLIITVMSFAKETRSEIAQICQGCTLKGPDSREMCGSAISDDVCERVSLKRRTSVSIETIDVDITNPDQKINISWMVISESYIRKAGFLVSISLTHYSSKPFQHSDTSTKCYLFENTGVLPENENSAFEFECMSAPNYTTNINVTVWSLANKRCSNKRSKCRYKAVGSASVMKPFERPSTEAENKAKEAAECLCKWHPWIKVIPSRKEHQLIVFVGPGNKVAYKYEMRLFLQNKTDRGVQFLEVVPNNTDDFKGTFNNVTSGVYVVHVRAKCPSECERNAGWECLNQYGWFTSDATPFQAGEIEKKITAKYSVPYAQMPEMEQDFIYVAIVIALVVCACIGSLVYIWKTGRLENCVSRWREPNDHLDQPPLNNRQNPVEEEIELDHIGAQHEQDCHRYNPGQIHNREIQETDCSDSVDEPLLTVRTTPHPPSDEIIVLWYGDRKLCTSFVKLLQMYGVVVRSIKREDLMANWKDWAEKCVRECDRYVIIISWNLHQLCSDYKEGRKEQFNQRTLECGPELPCAVLYLLREKCYAVDSNIHNHVHLVTIKDGPSDAQMLEEFVSNLYPHFASEKRYCLTKSAASDDKGEKFVFREEDFDSLVSRLLPCTTPAEQMEASAKELTMEQILEEKGRFLVYVQNV